MPEFRLPGLSIELPDGDWHAADADAPLSELLDRQQQELGTAAPMGWRRIANDDASLAMCSIAAASLRRNAQELLLIGMGGSINGARAVYQALELSGSVLCAVEFMDNPDPLSMISMLEVIEPELTAVLAVSRSGATVETLAMLATVLQHVPAGQRGDDGPGCAVCCLAGDNPLAELSARHGWQHIAMPGDIGGRFGVFSSSALVPLAFSGLDIMHLCDSAAEAAEQLEQAPPSSNPAWLLSGMLASGNCQEALLYCYGDMLGGFADWWTQLIAESTGRRLQNGASCGITPLTARGPADQHSLNQLLLDNPNGRSCCFVSVDDPGSNLSINQASVRLPAGFQHLEGLDMQQLMLASLQGTAEALRASGSNCAHIRLERADERSMASLLQLWMYCTACLGMRLGINPYDQPAVERSKRITDSLLRDRQ